MKKNSPRKIAEWLTLIGSTALFLGLAVFLIWDIFNAPSRFIDVKATAVLKEARRVKEHFILPIDVRNLGERTISVVKLQVEITDKENVEERELEFQYLGRNSKQRLYIYLSKNPRSLEIRVRPVSYSFN